MKRAVSLSKRAYVVRFSHLRTPIGLPTDRVVGRKREVRSCPCDRRNLVGTLLV